jgi:hypothetical protein
VEVTNLSPDSKRYYMAGTPVKYYSQADYNVALGIGMLAGLLIGGAAGVLLCAVLVRVLGI